MVIFSRPPYEGQQFWEQLDIPKGHNSECFRFFFFFFYFHFILKGFFIPKGYYSKELLSQKVNIPKIFIPKVQVINPKSFIPKGHYSKFRNNDHLG